MFPTDVEYGNITLYLWVIAGCALINAGVIILCYVYKRCGVADKLFVWMVTNGYTCYSHRSVSDLIYLPYMVSCYSCTHSTVSYFYYIVIICHVVACPASLYPICVQSEALLWGLASLGPSDAWQTDRSV